jgi:8-oxo-dGTP pyrophosphatase MutT (NUDIX family)
MDRRKLQDTLKVYKSDYDSEALFVDRMLSLLLHPNAYQRNHLPGHMTGSAWIINPAHTKVLLTHHAKLNRWLQPGGHADGDENIADVATKEAVEETGLKSLTLIQPDFFDIDIHSIPARNGFPEHEHFDVRFLFEADDAEDFIVSEESHDLAWVELTDLKSRTAANDSILRMAEKVSRLFRAN